MRTVVLAFAAGILWLQWQPALPGVAVLIALAVAGAASLWLLRLPRWRVSGAVGAFLLGISWAGWQATERLAETLPRALEGRDIELVGVIAGLPQRYENGLRFDFIVEQGPAAVPQRLSLAWYRGFRREEDDERHAVPQLVAGERWRLTVRLKRPHGNLNPDGFDHEAWLFERGIRATGYVRPAADNTRLAALVFRPGLVVERVRQIVRDRFVRVLGDPSAGGAPYGGVLTALAIGDQRAIDNDLWTVFRRTGTTHLMSISGLHVTMVAAIAWWLVFWGWRHSPRLPLLLPAQQAAALAGFVGAFLYCLLAGFGVPAQRTLYMLGVVALALWSGRVFASSRVLAVALLLVLLLDPWAVLAAGFWLSFGAVGLLFHVGSGRLAEGHWLAAWLRAQWAVTLGMIPALLALFQQFSLSSPLANAIAIPVVSFVVTPLALLGALPLTDPLLWLAHWLLALLMTLLEWLAVADWSIWEQHAPPWWAVATGVAGSTWLLLPQGVPARWLGLIGFLPLFFVPVLRPPVGQARVVTLDVGQGLAVHVQTAHHDLLFDTGPAFSPDANSGNRIIVPYLRAAGVRRLDTLVVSHADRDHSGGAVAVADAVPVARLSGSLPDGHEIRHQLAAAGLRQEECRDGEHWEWDGVHFEWLHPAAGDAARYRKSNDLSCVLRIVAAGRALLLTSDIEARVEAALLARRRDKLEAEVLLVPHHGSRTSSSPAFVAAVGAREAIFPVGYRNRFKHPRPEVIANHASARLWRSDRDGAITVFMGGETTDIVTERAQRRRYWHDRFED